MWNEFDFFITKSFCSVQFNSAFQRGVGEVVFGGGIATVFQQVDTNVTLVPEPANRKYTFSKKVFPQLLILYLAAVPLNILCMQLSI
jgi:hypothetical protein